jgi:hypothetical protein
VSVARIHAVAHQDWSVAKSLDTECPLAAVSATSGVCTRALRASVARSHTCRLGAATRSKNPHLT